MMKKKFIIIVGILVLGISAVMLFCPFGRRPFAKLSAGEIISAELFAIPPDKTVKITEKEDISELADILNAITVYREDDSGRDYAGQLVQVTIALQSGETHIIGAYGSFMFLDSRCYRTKYEPSERLNAFGNGILKR